MTLLIDADYLIYNSCCACEQDTRWNEWEHTLHTDERDIMNLIENRLAFYQSVAGSKHDVVMCFSSYPTFRHEIFPEYKINRLGKRKPLALKDIIKKIKDEYNSEYLDGLEGDDVLGLLATSNKYKDPIIVSVDKDMRTIPCKLIAEDEVEHITQRKADRHWFVLGVLSSVTAVIVWDLVKSRLKILNYEVKKVEEKE